MIKQVLLIFSVLFCANLSAAEADIEQKIRDLSLKHIGSMLKIKPITMRRGSEQVFQYPFYEVQPVLGKIAVAENEIIPLESPHTSMMLDSFKKTIRPDFFLDSPEKADLLQKSITPLFPFHAGKIDEQDPKKIANGWLIIRGAFFKNYKGLVFITNKEGKIDYIEYTLSINKEDFSYKSMYKGAKKDHALLEKDFKASLKLLENYPDKEKSCDLYPEKLSACKRFLCEKPNPLGRGNVTLYIHGKEKDKCRVITLTDHIDTDCAYSEKDLPMLVEQVKKFTEEKSFSISTRETEYTRIVKQSCHNFLKDGSLLPDRH